MQQHDCENKFVISPCNRRLSRGVSTVWNEILMISGRFSSPLKQSGGSKEESSTLRKWRAKRPLLVGVSPVRLSKSTCHNGISSDTIFKKSSFYHHHPSDATMPWLTTMKCCTEWKIDSWSLSDKVQWPLAVYWRRHTKSCIFAREDVRRTCYARLTADAMNFATWEK